MNESGRRTAAIILILAVASACTDDTVTENGAESGGRSMSAGGGSPAGGRDQAGMAGDSPSSGQAGTGEGGAAGSPAGLLGEGESCRFGGKCREGLICAPAECVGDNGPSCRKAPESCDDVLEPVCSCTDHSYANRCELERAPEYLVPDYPGECVVEEGVLKPGVWGGDGARLDVGANETTLHVACGEVAVNGPASIGPRSFFAMPGTRPAEWSGTYTPAGGTPQDAVFTGSMSNEANSPPSLTLTVTLSNGTELGAFELTHGSTADLPPCD